jgi:hypothetical protein
MNIQDIINNIAEGDNLAAKEGLEHVLSAKAFDALQGYKQEIASTLYGGQEQESEEDTDHEEDEEEGAYAEGVEHDGEQLDEVSLDAAAKVYKKRADNAYSNQSNSNVDKQVKSREVIGKRFGLKGKQMAKGIEKKYDNYAEGVEHDGKQLDEVSLELARKVYKQRAGGVVGTVDTKNRTTAQDKAQQERSKKIIDSRFGKKGKAVTHKVDTEHDFYQ